MPSKPSSPPPGARQRASSSFKRTSSSSPKGETKTRPTVVNNKSQASASTVAPTRTSTRAPSKSSTAASSTTPCSTHTSSSRPISCSSSSVSNSSLSAVPSPITAPLSASPSRPLTAADLDLNDDEELNEPISDAQIHEMLHDLEVPPAVITQLQALINAQSEESVKANEQDMGHPTPLTLSTIHQRTFPADDLVGRSTEQLDEMMSDCHQLILDSLSLTSIDLLSSNFTHVTHLYLQRNQITDISPLAHMSSLRFLVLSSNLITVVPDLTTLASLTFLDLSSNSINEKFDPELLPFYTQELRMSDNPCCANPSYEHHLLAVLPYLTKLDGKDITDELRRSYGLNVDESEAEDEVEEQLDGEHKADAMLIIEDVESRTSHTVEEAKEQLIPLDSR